MAFGPTQNYDAVSHGTWEGRPILAAVTRTLIAAGPAALAVGLGLAAVHWLPPRRVGLDPWAWLALEVVCATTVLVLATRAARRLVPLTTLLRLTLYFPDHAPSRLAVAMRHYSPDVLRPSLAAAGRRRGLHPEDDHAARILELVAAISDHDPVTRGHSERVQAYSALIAKELGLSQRDAAKLSWAALLHDVGKLRVPASVLSKPGQPTAQEWSVLVHHPEAGMEIAEPLREWLGPWLDVVGQHHERWDGTGYPAGLAGEEIGQGARIVAVADAYDVITSARSYKRALPAAAAREELARCAGEQFDPQVVRALLAVGLGRLRRVAGPLSVLSALPGLPAFAPDLSTVLQKLGTAGALKSTAAIGLVLSAVTATAGGALAGAPSSAEPPVPGPAGPAVIATPQAEHDSGSAVPAVASTTSDDKLAGGTSPSVAPGPATTDPAVPVPADRTSSGGHDALPTVRATPEAETEGQQKGKAEKVEKDDKGGNEGKGGGGGDAGQEGEKD
jgi:putative nucleotidyltransferase with HDIG domain